MHVVAVIVVGAGLLGLAAARALARRAIEVTVLEAARVGHERAGSKGAERIFRMGYDDPLYVDMAMRSYDLWRQLEDETGTELLRTVGQLTVGADLPRLLTTMREAGAAAQWLAPEAVADHFPGVAVSGPAVFEPSSGVLAADVVLRALARGVNVRDETPARRVRADGDQVVVDTDGGALRAEVAVVCAGVATGPLTGTAHTRATLEQVAYFDAPETNLPILVEREVGTVYGLPTFDGSRYKLGRHRTGPAVELAHAAFENHERLLASVVADAARVLPALRPPPVAAERCVYDMTPDEDFVLERVGRLVVGFGTSGHGFKFGPLLGELLADLATGTRPALPLQRFASSRLGARAEA